jgi:hypothetical protein
MTNLVMMAAIEGEGTPFLHHPAEEVALTPDPVHARAQGHIPPTIVAQCLGQDLDHAQGPFLPVDVIVAALDLDHGQDQGLARMSVEGERPLGEGGDRQRRGRPRGTP